MKLKGKDTGTQAGQDLKRNRLLGNPSEVLMCLESLFTNPLFTNLFFTR